MGRFFVYILYSISTDRFYIGQTENLEERLIQHNTVYFKNSYTHSVKDWVVFHKIECVSREQAVRIELHIKKAKKRNYLLDLKSYPEIGDKLLIKYSE